MADDDDAQYTLDGIEVLPAEPHRRNTNPNQVIGRPKGAKNKLTAELHAQIKRRGINFLDRMWDRAERLEDEIDFKCAVFIGSRIWTRPRGAAMQIDLTQTIDARSLLAAVADGSMTPADAAGLWNSISRNGTGAVAAIADAGEDRRIVAERLQGLIAARLAVASAASESGE
jgi:hypothetical protein